MKTIVVKSNNCIMTVTTVIVRPFTVFIGISGHIPHIFIFSICMKSHGAHEVIKKIMLYHLILNVQHVYCEKNIKNIFLTIF